MYKNQLITVIVLSSIAILGTVVMAIVFPIYYQSMFHFNRKYSSLVKRSNDAIIDTGVIQSYLNNCLTPDSNNIILEGWCENIIENVLPYQIKYQTTKPQQQLEM